MAICSIHNRVSSERKLSRKNAKIFVRISQTFRSLETLVVNRANLIKRKKEKTMRNFEKIVFEISREKKIPHKTIIIVAATINCAKFFLEFSALRAQH